MKKIFFVLMTVLASASSFAQDIDVIVSDGKIQFKVRGSGGYVCSAQDSFQKIPVLGRGVTRREAELNAKVGASYRAGNKGDVFFSRVISCEESRSGSGRIIMRSDNGGTRISVDGPSFVQCISESNLRHVPFIASAATQTEASALAGSACAAQDGDSGFFCRTQCEKVSQGGVVIGEREIKLPKIKFPKIKF